MNRTAPKRDSALGTRTEERNRVHDGKRLQAVDESAEDRLLHEGEPSAERAERLEKWAEEDIYHRILEKNKDGEPFILHDGPPYANGPIHIGHAFNKILKDFVIKSHAQRGYFTPYIPGWDCHGQPIEHEVEKKLGTEKARAASGEDAPIFAKLSRTVRAAEGRLPSPGRDMAIGQPLPDVLQQDAADIEVSRPCSIRV